MPSTSTKNVASMGCAILFITPFLLGGLFALGSGLFTLYQTPQLTEEVLAMLGVGSVFTLVGGGMLVGMVIGSRKEREAERLQAEEPDAPWRWRTDWTAGRVKSSKPAEMFIYWFFGIVFSGVGSILLFNIEEITRKGPIGYAVLLFPFAGIWMVGAAIYVTMRWLKYGQSHCDLVTNPGVVGGWFRAVIWARLKEIPAEGVETQLTCYHHYVSGSGKNRSTHRKVQWQETLVITPEFLAREADGNVAIPVRVHVPFDVKPTTPGAPENRIEWELTAKAAMPGIDFAAAFPVPLFVTDESSEAIPSEAETESLKATKAPYHPSILVEEKVDGWEFYAPPRRSLSMTFSVTLFALIWTAIIVGMLYSGEIPLLFPIFFGLFDILFLTAAFWLCFGKVRVTFRGDTVRVEKKALGLGSDVTLPLSSIQRIDGHITMQSGDVPYYTIRFHGNGRKRNTLGGIKNKEEVNDLIALMERCLAR